MKYQRRYLFLPVKHAPWPNSLVPSCCNHYNCSGISRRLTFSSYRFSNRRSNVKGSHQLFSRRTADHPSSINSSCSSRSSSSSGSSSGSSSSGSSSSSSRSCIGSRGGVVSIRSIGASPAPGPATSGEIVCGKFLSTGTIQGLLPEALKSHSAGSCVKTAGSRSVSARARWSSSIDSNSSVEVSNSSVSIERSYLDSSWMRTRKGYERRRPMLFHAQSHNGSCCSRGYCSKVLKSFAGSSPQWSNTIERRICYLLRNAWMSSYSTPSCAGFSWYRPSHGQLEGIHHDDASLLFPCFSSSSYRPLVVFPHILEKSSSALQSTRSSHLSYIRTRSSISSLLLPSPPCCLVFSSSLILSSSFSARPSLSSQYVSSYIPTLAFPTPASFACVPSSVSSMNASLLSFRCSFTSMSNCCLTLTPPRLSGVYEGPSTSLLRPSRLLWPCAEQLHTSLLLSVLQRGEIAAPTDVQERSVPALLAGESSLIVAPTGSGKTLAWALPLVSRLLHADRERLAPYKQQPRLLVLVPSRELAQQLLVELRKHFNSAGVSIAAAAAGQSYVKEVRALMGGRASGGDNMNGGRRGEGVGGGGVDVLITTPARLMLHLHKRNLNLRRVKAVVVEEADTLCDTFYEQELLFILHTLHQVVGGSAAATLRAVAAAAGSTALSVQEQREEGERYHREDCLETPRSRERREMIPIGAGGRGESQKQTRLCTTATTTGHIQTRGIDSTAERTPVQLVFVSATKTGALGRFLKKQLEGMPLTFICSPDAHMTNPGVQQVFVPLGSEDRITRLLEVLDEQPTASAGGAAGGGASSCLGRAADADGKKTIIFCNTVNSCRAVDLTLVEKGYRVSCLHGMMPFKLRKTSFRRFKEGHTDILVCTNVASRGLEIDGVHHVIMFDFPQTLADYLHRSGRTARAGETGRVTLLFSKRNLPLIQQIQNISKATVTSPELRHATPRMRRLLRLEERWRELVAMRNPKRKIGGRRKLGLPPNRKVVSPKTKWMLKRLHFRLKATSRLKFLRSRGILFKKELLPKHPRLSIERSDAQQSLKMIRSEDGLMQVLPTRRSKYFMRRKAQESEEGQYEQLEKTIPIEGRTYAEEKAARPPKHHRKTYF